MIGSVSTKIKKKYSNNSSPIITFPDSLIANSYVEIPANVHVVEPSTTKSKSGGKKTGKKKSKQNSKEKSYKNESSDKIINIVIT